MYQRMHDAITYGLNKPTRAIKFSFVYKKISL